MALFSLSLLAEAIISALLLITALVVFLLRFSRGKLWVGVALGIALVDQVSKLAVRHFLHDGRQVALPGSAALVYSENRLLGFGLSDSNLLAAAFAAFAALILLFLRLRQRGYRMGFLAELSSALILGGCAGILIDRVRLGFVIDWLDFGPKSDFIYNLADLAVLAAAVLLAARGTQLLLDRLGRSLLSPRPLPQRRPLSSLLQRFPHSTPEEAGCAIARALRTHFGDLPAHEMAAALGLKVEHRPLPPPGLSVLHVRSQYLADSAAILLYDEPLRELALRLSARRPDLAHLDLEAIHIAHEIFHHLESAPSRASEKAAASFVTELLYLDFSPEELDSLYAADNT